MFEPVEPIDILGFQLQGLFLQRQKEVSAEFSEFTAAKLLTPKKIWNELTAGEMDESSFI
jgi:uncharacterized membrane protein YheB (UPF0754 family)